MGKREGGEIGEWRNVRVEERKVGETGVWEIRSVYNVHCTLYSTYAICTLLWKSLNPMMTYLGPRRVPDSRCPGCSRVLGPSS